jgi:hypothetical protein
VAKELPRVEERLRAALEEWEDANGRAFVVEDERLVDRLDAEEARERRERDEGRARKERERRAADEAARTPKTPRRVASE